jgi:peptidoglycan/LPS O-acetylase OafA/YrhL
MTASARRPHLGALTGLRFVASLLVLLHHTQAALAPEGAPWLHALAEQGYLGVGLFFLLSGFILSYNYLADGAPVDRGEFWRARFARVYPVYALSLALSLPLFLRALEREGAGPAGAGAVGAAVLSLTQAWFPSAACEWNCPGWSLSVEAFFYLAFPFLAGPLVRLPARRLVPAMAALWAAALVVPALFTALGLDARAAGPEGWRTPERLLVQYNPLLHLPEFAIGVLAGRWHLLRQGARASGAAGWERWGASAALAALLAVMVLGGGLPFLLLHNGLLAPLFALLVLALAAGADPLARLLARPLPRLLGEASFALYILHLPLWMFLLAADKRLGWHLLPSLPVLAAFGAGAVAVSVLVLRGVEEPARRWLRRRWAGHAAAGAARPG